MDKFTDESINSSNNSNKSKHVYKMHETNAYTLDVVCMNSSNNNNNNNNEKMDDANQTATTTTTTAANQKINTSMVRQDSINSDFSPLTDSIQQINADDHRHRNGIDFRSADDEYSINDNQSNASDEASDNNSTDNISFVSEDIVENIILLPNNFLSDDESTNSDDVVYAYRGADFEPVHMNADVNADEETDYLEMDFEPDPASEIEPEPNQSIEPSHNHIAPPSPNFNSPNLFNTISNTLSNTVCTNAIGDLSIERTGVHKNWLAPIEVRLNGICNGVKSSDSANRTNRHENIHATNNNKIEVNAASNEMESNKSLATKKNSTKIPLTQQQQQHNGQINSTYYDNTVSLSTKKYTGTIPKTSKSQVRPTRSKITNSDLAINGNSLTRFESQASSSAHCSLELWSNPGSSNQTHKRWKISDQDKSVSSSYCDNLGDHIDNASNAETDHTHTKRPLYTARSMSFPNENHLDQRSITTNYKAVRAIICEPVVKREIENDADQSLSVTFESTYCTIDTIIKALEKINVMPNVRALQQALRDDECNVSQMNIPDYFIYASKRYCNYKAIIRAIEQSCEDVVVEFLSPPNDTLKTVHIPVRMIASRLPTNGSLANILTIKNKRFHQMNVLGKIVNVIRRFPEMRDDLIHNELIAIPQYYRSGFICISKKKPSTNQI